MNIDLSFVERDDYLLVRIEGKWTLTVVQQAIEEIAAVAQAGNHTRILIDARKLLSPKTDFDRFLAGKQVARAFRGKFKAAIVYPDDLINKFLENTAVNRGLEIIVLSDIGEAKNWLMA